jgi:hypothetical protein
MDVNVLMAAQLLVEVVAAARLPRLLHQFYHSVLLDFRWCPLIGLFSWIFQVLRNPDPGSKFFTIPDPVKEFKYFYPKNKFLSSRLGNKIRVVHPGSGLLIFTHPGFRGQKGTGPGSATLVGGGGGGGQAPQAPPPVLPQRPPGLQVVHSIGVFS